MHCLNNDWSCIKHVVASRYQFHLPSSSGEMPSVTPAASGHLASGKLSYIYDTHDLRNLNIHVAKSILFKEMKSSFTKAFLFAVW